jgi:hypothetical protein
MRTSLSTALMIAAPRAVFACPVCFGQNDSPMASAANLSILVMLVIVGGVLAGFASFFIYLMRRARMVAAEASHDGATGRPADGLRPGYGGPPKLHAKAEASRYAVGEGTAQC